MAANKKSLEARAAAAPTDLHKAFAEWLKIETGVDVDLKTVQLACSMRMDFQRSEENQKDLAKRKQAAMDKKKAAAAEKKARLEKQLAAIQADLAKVQETDSPAVKVQAPKTGPEQVAAKKATPAPRTRRAPKALDNAPETDAAPKPRTRRAPAKKTAPAAK